MSGTLVIAGGHATKPGNSNYSNDVWTSDDGGNSWQQVLEHAPWSPRSYQSCVVLPQDRLLLVGGHDEDDWFNDVWISGPKSDLTHWEQLHADAPFSARCAAALQYQDSSGKVFFMAGGEGLPRYAGGSGATLYNDVWASSDDGATWELVTENADFKAREGFTGGVAAESSPRSVAAESSPGTVAAESPPGRVAAESRLRGARGLHRSEQRERGRHRWEVAGHPRRRGRLPSSHD